MPASSTIPSLRSLYDMALLTSGAYSNLDSTGNVREQLQRDTAGNVNLLEAAAQYLVNNFDFKDQANASDIFGSTTGFSATLWQVEPMGANGVRLHCSADQPMGSDSIARQIN